MDSDSGVPNIKVMLGLAAAFSIGALCNIIAGVIWTNWWPMIVVIFYVLSPLPNLFCARCGLSDPMDISGRNFKDMGYFLTGTFVTGGFALPLVLAHTEVITVGALLLTLAGGIIVYVTLVVYIHLFHTRKSSDF